MGTLVESSVGSPGEGPSPPERQCQALVTSVSPFSLPGSKAGFLLLQLGGQRGRRGGHSCPDCGISQWAGLRNCGREFWVFEDGR